MPELICVPSAMCDGYNSGHRLFRAEAHEPISAADRSSLETFVKRWYRLPASQLVTFVDSESVDSACYRKVVFRASISAPLLVLYLRPDKKGLVTGIMDLEIPPAIAQRRKQLELKTLLAFRALLTTGSTDAPVSLVVFSDCECPYCERFAAILQRLSPEERARLQILYRQLPLDIHPWASEAAQISTCVALQDRAAFWKLHDFFFSEQQELSKETLMNQSLAFLRTKTTVDQEKVKLCFAERGYLESLQRDDQLATDLGIRATPTIFLNGQRISVRSVDDLRSNIKTAEEGGRLTRSQRQESSLNNNSAKGRFPEKEAIARRRCLKFRIVPWSVKVQMISLLKI